MSIHDFHDDSLLQVDVKVPGTNEMILHDVRLALENNKGLVLGTGYSCQAAARFIGQPLAGFIFLNF